LQPVVFLRGFSQKYGLGKGFLFARGDGNVVGIDQPQYRNTVMPLSVLKISFDRE
jgi:predicted ATP-grasp superfamily ATP-dependent carboligase